MSYNSTNSFWPSAILAVVLATITGVGAYLAASDSGRTAAEATFSSQLLICLEEQRRLIEENTLLHSLKDDKVSALMAFADRAPWPMWIKEANTKTREDPKMLWVNRAYYVEYGVDTLSYQGRTDRDVWGDEVGGAFIDVDWSVIDSTRPRTTLERVPVNPENPEGSAHWVIVTKYRVNNTLGKDIVWVGGILVPDKFVRTAIEYIDSGVTGLVVELNNG